MRMELLCDSRCKVGESPLWTDDGVLLWLDIPGQKLHRWHGGAHTRLDLPCMISAIAPAPAGLVAAGQAGFGLLSHTADAADYRPLANVLPVGAAMRMNDGALDRQGRFWAGSMGLPPEPARPAGQLFCFTGAVGQPQVSGLLVQNGLAFSPDGRTMYLSDSHPSVSTVWRFDYDPDCGIASNQSVFSDRHTLGGRPDGAAIDTDGCYWIAASDGGRVVRLTPDGVVDVVIEVPTRNPTNVCFGGPDRRTMFVTSLVPAMPDSLAGGVFVLETPWQGLRDTPFTGPIDAKSGISSV